MQHARARDAGATYKATVGARCGHGALSSEGGMMRLETLIELKFLNSSFSSPNVSFRAFRACPLIETRQIVPCRAIRGKSSDSRQQYRSQQNPPPLLILPAAQALMVVDPKKQGRARQQASHMRSLLGWLRLGWLKIA